MKKLLLVLVITLMMTGSGYAKVDDGTSILCPELNQGFLFDSILEPPDNYFDLLKLYSFNLGLSIKDPRKSKSIVKDITVHAGQLKVSEKIYTYEEGPIYIIFPGTKLNRNTIKVEGMLLKYDCKLSTIDEINNYFNDIVDKNKIKDDLFRKEEALVRKENKF